MDKALKKDLAKYYSEIKRFLFCSSAMKKAFISCINERINEFTEDNNPVSIKKSREEFGEPKEIAKQFTSECDVEKVKEKAKRIILYRILAVALILIVILLVYVVWDVIHGLGSIIVVTEGLN